VKQGTAELQIPAQLFAAADSYCREQGITMYALFASVFQLTLHRHSGLDQLLIVSPKAERDHPLLAGTIGVYLNMLPIHSQVRDDDSLASYLARMRQSIIQAQANMDVHFEAVRAAIDDREADPLSQVNFQYYHFPEETPWRLVGLETLPFGLSEDIEYTNTLDLRMVRTQQGVAAYYVYNTALFSMESIEDMKRSYLEILDAATARSHCPLLLLIGATTAASARPH
jgi:non-ribosomal peptide synthetase component F